MKLTEYQKLAARTIPQNTDGEELLDNFAMGLVGEAGELFEIFKKHWYHGKKLDLNKLKEELGGVLWYIAGVYTVFGRGMDNDDAQAMFHIDTKTALSYMLRKVTSSYTDLFYYGVGITYDDIYFGSIELSKIVKTLTFVAENNGTTLNDVMEYNIAQLKERHPNGFDPSYHN